VISCLTSNEDDRQDLWVSYLSGTPLDALTVKLETNRQESEENSLLETAAYQIMSELNNSDLIALISKFSILEQSIMLYLAYGLSPEAISRYKRISYIRIQQIISTIRSNSSWESYLDGIKEKIHRA
jgi:hypothetical protein